MMRQNRVRVGNLRRLQPPVSSRARASRRLSGASLSLACLHAENFRIFGSTPRNDGDADASLCLEFGPAKNVLVGENSGKTAIIDAIRLCLLTAAGPTSERTDARAPSRSPVVSRT
ncbi:AAA family ATPase [Streptomyces sp. NPDC020794]|uniref:AAA family ATPase n=2 Tax=Streptomyces TaxID=1883 RepID=UPI003799C03F